MHRYGCDVNGDGSVDANDEIEVANAQDTHLGDAGYDAELDFDRNGEVNSADWDLLYLQYGKWLAGDISDRETDPMLGVGPDNVFGYAGYAWSPGSSLYLARHRWYDPSAGRWLQRDPLGYVDGMNVYQYVGGGPGNAMDPMGLWGEDWATTKTINSNSAAARAGYTFISSVGTLAESTVHAITAPFNPNTYVNAYKQGIAREASNAKSGNYTPTFWGNADAVATELLPITSPSMEIYTVGVQGVDTVDRREVKGWERFERTGTATANLTAQCALAAAAVCEAPKAPANAAAAERAVAETAPAAEGASTITGPGIDSPIGEFSQSIAGPELEPVGNIPISQLRYSQTTVNGPSTARLTVSMRQLGYVGEPIDTVASSRGPITLDHRRPLAASAAGMDTVPYRLHQPSSSLPAFMQDRFPGASTWGEALEARLNRNHLPSEGTDQLPRLTGERCTK